MKKPSLMISPKHHNHNKLTTPTDLGDKARQAISGVLNPLVADIFALYVKTKAFHLHVSGSHYRDYHLLFDEHAGQIFAMIDVFAERVRKLGGTTIRSVKHIHELQTLHDATEIDLPAREMVIRLMEDNKSLLATLRHAHHICAQYEDVATTSIIEVYIDETERRIWLLFETQAG